MRDTKPNLNNQKFEQFTGDTLTLSGRTEVHGILEIENGGIVQILSDGQIDNYSTVGYEISGTSFLRAGGDISSLAIGCNTDIGLGGSVAIGDRANALNSASVAIGVRAGDLSTGSTIKNISIGACANYVLTTIGNYSIGIGVNSQSIGSNSISLGRNTKAYGINGVAIGFDSCACEYDINIGYQSESHVDSGGAGIALGFCSQLCSLHSIAIGTRTNLTTGTVGACNVSIGDCANYGVAADIGAASIAIGRIAKSVGNNSVAIGCGAKTFDEQDTAVGTGAVASGRTSSAFGRFSLAGGCNSIALGNLSIAYGTASFSGGYLACANTNSIALGSCAKGSGFAAIAIGGSAEATATDSIAMGRGSNGLIQFAIAIGCGAYGKGHASVGIGSRSRAVGNCSFAVGFSSQATGGSSIAIGERTCAFGSGAIAIGCGAKTFDVQDTAVGTGAVASGRTSSAFGRFSLAGGCNSIALGNLSIAYGTASFSGGFLACANTNSIALGSCAKGSGFAAIAIGGSAEATATDSIAMGKYAKAVGGTSVAIGFGSDANVACSIGMGRNVQNNQTCSVGFGWGNSDINPAILFAQTSPSYIYGTGNDTDVKFGLATTGATARLDIVATGATEGFRLRDTSEANNLVLTSDASGYGTWKSVGSIGGSGITGSTNGLTDNGTDVCWGGDLSVHTCIDGGGLYSINYSCLTSLCFGNAVANQQVGTFDVNADTSLNILTTDVAGGAPYRSELSMTQCVTTIGSRSGTTNLVRAVFDGFNGGILITDDVAEKGLCYAGDYSDNWTDRSIPDKAYVDSIASGLDAKDAVVVATTSSDGDINLVLFTSTLDGLTVQDGWRVLIKNQTDATENGVYDYSGASSGFTRSTDFDGTPAGEVSNGAFMNVVTGDTLINTQWILTTADPITIGVSDLTFSLLSQQLGITAGDGIDINTVGSNEEISTRLKSGGGLAFDTGEMYVVGVEKTAKAIVQATHGFVVGNAIAYSGGTYIKAIMDGTMDAEVFGLVTEVSDTNNFVVTLQGFVDTLSGLVANTTYFVSDTTAGNLTATEPTTDGHISKPILATTTTTAGLVLPYRGSFISTGDTSINKATNGLSVDGTAVKLGGDLCETTTINIGAFSLTIGDKPIQYTADYSAQYDPLSIPDVGYVTGLTTTLESSLQANIDANAADITYLSGETDLRLVITDFETYSGVTDTRLDGIDDDIIYLSGETDLKLNIADFDVYSAATASDISTNASNIADNAADITYLSGQTNLRLVISDFETYSAATSADIDYISGNTGEVNAGSNVGVGNGIYTGKTGVDLQFKSLSGGSNIALIDDGSTITISGGSAGGSSTLTGNTIVGNDASTIFTINHGCGTRDIMIQVYENQTPWGNILVAIEKPNTACITLTFDTAPATGEDYRVLMLT